MPIGWWGTANGNVASLPLCIHHHLIHWEHGCKLNWGSFRTSQASRTKESLGLSQQVVGTRKEPMFYALPSVWWQLQPRWIKGTAAHLTSLKIMMRCRWRCGQVNLLDYSSNHLKAISSCFLLLLLLFLLLNAMKNKALLASLMNDLHSLEFLYNGCFSKIISGTEALICLPSNEC